MSSAASLEKNKFRNNDKAIGIGNKFWEETARNGLAGIVANVEKGGYLRTLDGHAFKNLSCCSYLDLDSHPHVIDGAISALKKYGVLDHCITRTRIQLPALLELEERLSTIFRSKVLSSLSASAATASLLPLIASGHLNHGNRPVMVFDKQCHFSMNLFKPVCGDETLVLTSPHNDLNFLEDVCKRYPVVAYVCDGTYSMGGHAPLEGLLALQEKYGLFLYFDDSHSISIMGSKGEGYIRSNIEDFNDRTIIVGTLNKAFGTSGAAVLIGNEDKAIERIIERFGGPMAWSQPMNTAAIGASLASADIHESKELLERQEKLHANIMQFDSIIDTDQKGNSFPIRLVAAEGDKVVSASKELYESGFYVSPVFFPIVPRNQAGLRVMLRAGLDSAEVARLCKLLTEIDLF